MSIAAENVIGGILLAGKDAYWRVADLLSPEDFATRLHASLYRLIRELVEAGVDVDAVTVADEADRQGIANIDAVYSLASATASAANIRGYGELVKQEAATRRFRAVCAEGAKTGDVTTTQAAIASILSSQPSSAVRSAEVVKRMWDNVVAKWQSGDELGGLRTGFPELDEYTGGLQAGRVYGIGARAKMGKTILAMNICANVACPPIGRDGELEWEPKAVAIWSLEMTDEELVQRMSCGLSGVGSEYFKNPKLFDRDDEVMPKLHVAAKRLKDARLWISDKTDVSIEQIEAQCRQMHAMGNLDLLCIDYLGLLKLPKTDRHDLAIAHITRRVKIIAKELKIPVILAFQLNRGSENGQQVRPPRPSDARDSGAIEQDLDAMLLLHRPNYYDQKARKGLRLDLALQRNGPTGLMDLEDQLDRCRYVSTGRPWVDAPTASYGNDL